MTNVRLSDFLLQDSHIPPCMRPHLPSRESRTNAEKQNARKPRRIITKRHHRLGIVRRKKTRPFVRPRPRLLFDPRRYPLSRLQTDETERHSGRKNGLHKAFFPQDADMHQPTCGEKFPVLRRMKTFSAPKKRIFTAKKRIKKRITV